MSIKFTIDTLNSFCLEQKIQLSHEYVKVNEKTVIKGVCLNNCGELFEKTFRSLMVHGGGYCKSCVKKNKYEKTKKTNLEKYGCENLFSNKDIIDKIKKTNLKKYGETCYLKTDIGKFKTKETNLLKYGVENISQSNVIKIKKNETTLQNFGVRNPSQSEIIKKQVKNTNNEKYGCDYGFQNDEIKSKIKNTFIKKYGVIHISQLKDTKEKVKNTCLQRYGVECPLQNDTIKEKTKNTNFLKYGVEYPIQNPEIMEKHVKSSHNRKNYIFPSGRIEIVQGYEPFALNNLIINEKINESDIIVGVKNVPEIKFNDCDGKIHRYYVDIFIPSQNKCIEVKSLYTYNDNIKINLLKQEAAIKLGYDFEFWIYDKKGNRLNIYDNILSH